MTECSLFEVLGRPTLHKEEAPTDCPVPTPALHYADSYKTASCDQTTRCVVRCWTSRSLKGTFCASVQIGKKVWKFWALILKQTNFFNKDPETGWSVMQFWGESNGESSNWVGGICWFTIGKTAVMRQDNDNILTAYRSSRVICLRASLSALCSCNRITPLGAMQDKTIYSRDPEWNSLKHLGSCHRGEYIHDISLES